MNFGQPADLVPGSVDHMCSIKTHLAIPYILKANASIIVTTFTILK